MLEEHSERYTVYLLLYNVTSTDASKLRQQNLVFTLDMQRLFFDHSLCGIM